MTCPSLTILVERRRGGDIIDDHIIAFKRTLSNRSALLSLVDRCTYFTLFTKNEFFRDELGHGIIFLERSLSLSLVLIEVK